MPKTKDQCTITIKGGVPFGLIQKGRKDQEEFNSSGLILLLSVGQMTSQPFVRQKFFKWKYGETINLQRLLCSNLKKLAILMLSPSLHSNLNNCINLRPKSATISVCF